MIKQTPEQAADYLVELFGKYRNVVMDIPKCRELDKAIADFIQAQRTEAYEQTILGETVSKITSELLESFATWVDENFTYYHFAARAVSYECTTKDLLQQWLKERTDKILEPMQRKAKNND